MLSSTYLQLSPVCSQPPAVQLESPQTESSVCSADCGLHPVLWPEVTEKVALPHKEIVKPENRASDPAHHSFSLCKQQKAKNAEEARE